ncbi:MAG: response regulator transcription factor [Agriterribacter sp.]
MNILLIEDDQRLNKNISEMLESEALHTTSVYDGFQAERLLKKKSFDCIIMDIDLPGKKGFDLCRDFRQYDVVTPVIMLTAFGELDDKVQGFDCGADDYLTKPFYMKELLLRINAVSKRNAAANSPNNTIAAGDIVIHQAAKKVMRQGCEIILTPREYEILVRLIANKGELVSKKQLIKEIWGRHFDANTNTIEVYINFLRNKIDKPFERQSIKTRVGYGYYFDESA